MSSPLRVAVLIDLPRTRLSGGHVKGWERRARAAAKSDLPLDLTLYCSGEPLTEALSPHVRFKHLPPVFSTSRLTFLPYVPDHTDLASFHPTLAEELKNYDVIHSTDAYFAFAKTAEKIAPAFGIPIVYSFHTDTPAYTRVFTQKTIETLCGKTIFSRFLTETLKIPERQERKMRKRLRTHLAACDQALAIREEDRVLAEKIIGPENVHSMNLGIDLEMFSPRRRNRALLESDYGVPKDRMVVLFVGRLDEGKNIYTLIDAMEKLIGEGLPLHLIAAGVGPAEESLRARLKGHVSIPGFVDPDELAILYASVDGLALCSEVEIRSLVGIEALASGLPVLVSEKSGIAPNFNNTPAMRVVSGGADAWASALRLLASDPALRDHMAQTALAYTKQFVMSWEEVFEKDFFQTWQKAYEDRKA